MCIFSWNIIITINIEHCHTKSFTYINPLNWQNSFVEWRLTPPLYRLGHWGGRGKYVFCKYVSTWEVAGIGATQSSSGALLGAQEPWSELLREGLRFRLHVAGALTRLLDLFSSSPAGLALSSEWLRWLTWPECCCPFKKSPCGHLIIPRHVRSLCLVYCFRRMVGILLWWCVTEGIWERLIFVCLFCRTWYLWIWHQDSSCYFTLQESVSCKQEINQV